MSYNEDEVAKRFEIGNTLNSSFSIFLKKSVPFVLIAVIFQIPVIAWDYNTGYYLIDPFDFDASAAVDWSEEVIRIGLASVFSFLANAAITYGVVMHVADKKVSLKDCMLIGVSLFVPIVIIGILCNLLYFSGFLLLIFPGFFALVYLFVVYPVAVIEQPGIMISFSRSGYLTKGNRWPLLGIILILVIVVIGFVSIGKFISDILRGWDYHLLAYILHLTLSSFGYVFWLIVSTISYQNLRTEKEGGLTNQVASVFD